MTIATADADGTPWVTPVFYSHDRQSNLFWVSSRNARHSENLRARATVGIVIFTTDDQVDGVYIEAHAEELTHDVDIEDAIHVMSKRAQPERFRTTSVADATGNAARRIYKAVPKQVYIREEAVEGGQAVTMRRPIDLAFLSSELTG